MVRNRNTQSLSTDPVDVALRQARRERCRGKHRKAMLHLRRAAFEAEHRPGLWNRYALCCARSGKMEEGRKAFAQAAWLFERDGRSKTAAVTRRLAEQAEQGILPGPYAKN